MIDIGVTMFLHGDDYGRDPRAFIGWANDTKLVFFYAMLAAAGLSVILCFVIIFNISTPQTRKDSVVEQLSSQGTGLTIMVMIFGMTWGFAFPAYIRFPDKETPDFFPIFQGMYKSLFSISLPFPSWFRHLIFYFVIKMIALKLHTLISQIFFPSISIRHK